MRTIKVGWLLGVISCLSMMALGCSEGSISSIDDLKKQNAVTCGHNADCTSNQPQCLPDNQGILNCYGSECTSDSECTNKNTATLTYLCVYGTCTGYDLCKLGLSGYQRCYVGSELRCLNIASDNSNCGSCGNACDADGSQTCQSGICRDAIPPCPDKDGDAYLDFGCGGTDFNDNDASINPGALEICTDNKDNDCDGLTDTADPDCGCPDNDGDNYRDMACGGTDCNDNDASINLGALEICSDYKDNDCDGLTDTADPDCAVSCGAVNQACCTSGSPCNYNLICQSFICVSPGYCGDGIVNNGEYCDGSNLNGYSCQEFGVGWTGMLRCNSNCTFDTTGCQQGCTPNCAGRNCGPDPVCGTDCGYCPGVCQNGNCTTCTPNCVGKNCGANDGCNGKCTYGAWCPTNQSCNGEGICRCNAPYIDCGQTCCSAGQTCQYDGSQLRCVG